ncbi:pectinesterase-like [Neltuma alba]|uniref:pectinesterase-like n=1 Tax=Neltuma alba TaxID=207710 RepID=UPI0010A370AF|nr:pectinesterase-like [Prosopis alba]
MNGKVIVPAVSIILVVGVALGVVGIVHYRNNSSNGQPETNTHTKAVAAICQSSDDPKLCHNTLDPVNSTDPKDYIKAVVESAMNTVIQSFNLTDRVQIEHGNSSTRGIKMAVEDCKDLLQSAIAELQASGVLVQDNNARSVTDREDDLKNWLSAVIAYQQSCLDGFETDNDGEKAIQQQLQAGGLDNVEKLTGLALDVVAGISQFLSVLDLDLDVKPASRRLLSNVAELDHDGYPTWISGPDRQLIELPNTGHPTDQPNAVVAQDGSGQFKTIQEAINSYPPNFQGRFTIYVKAGIYNEYVHITKKQPNILMYGDGPNKTIVTGNRSYTSGWKTIKTATFTTLGDGFIAKSMAFENTAGAEGHQAVALRVMGDRSAFFDCAMRGYQDTLYAHAKRQFYRNCEISGTVDFIFGYGSTLIQNSRILVRKPMDNQQNIVVADGTAQKQMRTGIVLQNCQIMADASLQADRLTVKSYLARPWKAYSRAIFMESEIGDLINADGYLPWMGSMFLDTCYFAEYANTGPGAATNNRVKWSHGVITKDDATQYTAEPWLQAGSWLPATGIAFDSGLTKA